MLRSVGEFVYFVNYAKFDLNVAAVSLSSRTKQTLCTFHELSMMLLLGISDDGIIRTTTTTLILKKMFITFYI